MGNSSNKPRDICDEDSPTSCNNPKEGPELKPKGLMKTDSENIYSDNGNLSSDSSLDSMLDYQSGKDLKRKPCKISETKIVLLQQQHNGINRMMKRHGQEATLGLNDTCKKRKIADESEELDKLSDSWKVEPNKPMTVSEKNYTAADTSPSSTCDPKYLYYCAPCEKRFNGEKPHKQHLNSSKHLKKVRTNLDPALASSENFTCEICCVKLNGPVPYQDHMKSAKHAKKVKADKLSASGCEDKTIKVNQTEKEEEKELGFSDKTVSNSSELDVYSIGADEPINFK